jgi:hypothetical protein
MVINILDSNGNTIGTLELPDGTTQDVVNAQLALYSYTPVPSTPNQIVSSAIQEAIDFGAQLLTQYATENVLSGITQANQTASVANYLQTVAYYLNSGSLYAAMDEINTLIADTSSTKAALAPFVTNNILYYYLNEIQTYLEIPLTVNSGS